MTHSEEGARSERLSGRRHEEPTRADQVIPFDRLPPRFAESLENPPEVPVAPRAAATVVLLRDATGGMEVLLMRRTRNAGFVPGAYVFPGGRVDTGDGDGAALARVDGLTLQTAADRLGSTSEANASGTPAIAYYMAALREAFEETGILVARTRDGRPVPTAAEETRVDVVRGEVMDDRISFAQALDHLDCRIDGSAVAYMAHWVTPEPEPRRYDTRFFAARVRDGATPIIDEREMTDAVWISPTDALRRNRAGSLPMVFPTIKTLETLAAFDDADDAVATLDRRTVPMILPRLVVTPTGIGMELDVEP